MRLLVCILGLVATVAVAEPSPEGERLLSLRLTHAATLERGRATPLSIGLQLAPGARLLDDGPLTLELEGTALTPARRVLHRKDAVDARAEAPRFEVEVRAERAGAPSLQAHLLAWVCRGQRCRPVELTTPIALGWKAP